MVGLEPETLDRVHPIRNGSPLRYREFSSAKAVMAVARIERRGIGAECMQLNQLGFIQAFPFVKPQ